MSITLDDKAVDVFKLYDEMTIAYSKDIEGYKTLLKSIEAMITQKEEMLQDIKDKTIGLLKSSLDIKASPKPRVRKKGRKIKTVAVNEEAVAAGDEIDTGGAVIEIAHHACGGTTSGDNSSHNRASAKTKSPSPKERGWERQG